MPTSLSTKKRRDSNIFFRERGRRPCTASPRRSRSTIVSAGKRRPRLIFFELGHVPSEVALDHARLIGGHDEIGAVDATGDAESRKAHQRRPQMLDARVGDAKLRSGDGGESDE